MKIGSTQFIWLAFLGSLSLLVGAYAFEFLGGLKPCKMCLWQRWPHLGAVIIGLLVLSSKSVLLMRIACIVVLVGAGIAFFHMGVEFNWWEGPSTCTSGSITNLTSAELMKKILEAPITRCDDIPWSFVGLSMAGWNGILSIILSYFWLKASFK
jgi:disulfide bond formation protein DsbB